ncbi:transcriptional regulator [Eubacterium sp. AM28-29]|nr:transcriptional regulator [Eubacterium sp. AM28-29]
MVRIRKSTKSHVSTSHKVLEDRGFIERRVDKDNKKHVTIHLLQLANEVIEDGIWAQKEFAQDMFEGLSEEEIKVFMNVFQKVYDNAERMISNEKNA